MALKDELQASVVELSLSLFMETEKALLVGDGSRLDAKWVPKSQCQSIEIAANQNSVELTIPEWLAKAKGLI